MGACGCIDCGISLRTSSNSVNTWLWSTIKATSLATSAISGAGGEFNTDHHHAVPQTVAALPPYPEPAPLKVSCPTDTWLLPRVTAWRPYPDRGSCRYCCCTSLPLYPERAPLKVVCHTETWLLPRERRGGLTRSVALADVPATYCTPHPPYPHRCRH